MEKGTIRCRNERCIYNENGTCSLNFIQLGEYGCCEMQRFVTGGPLYAEQLYEDDEEAF